MGAQVFGCGHASQLFKVEFLAGAPQVHLHFLTDDDEYARDGEGRIEFVCHSCGESMLLIYDESGSRRRYLAVRNKFRDKHSKCLNRNYDKNCPDYRSSSTILDQRRLLQDPKAKSVRAP
jgi:hypothetical protein